MTSEELAYLAGIVDGEGCISLIESSSVHKLHGPRYKPETQGRVYGRYKKTALVISVGMAFKEIPEWLYLEFGGTLYLYKRSGNYKDYWVWRASHKKALACIEAILPYLRVKRQQAELALAFQKDRTTRRNNAVLKQVDAILAEGMRKLNAQGKAIARNNTPHELREGRS